MFQRFVSWLFCIRAMESPSRPALSRSRERSRSREARSRSRERTTSPSECRRIATLEKELAAATAALGDLRTELHAVKEKVDYVDEELDFAHDRIDTVERKLVKGMIVLGRFPKGFDALSFVKNYITRHAYTDCIVSKLGDHGLITIYHPHNANAIKTNWHTSGDNKVTHDTKTFTVGSRWMSTATKEAAENELRGYKNAMDTEKANIFKRCAESAIYLQEYWPDMNNTKIELRILLEDFTEHQLPLYHYYGRRIEKKKPWRDEKFVAAHAKAMNLGDVEATKTEVQNCFTAIYLLIHRAQKIATETRRARMAATAAERREKMTPPHEQGQQEQRQRERHGQRQGGPQGRQTGHR